MGCEPYTFLLPPEDCIQSHWTPARLYGVTVNSGLDSVGEIPQKRNAFAGTNNGKKCLILTHEIIIALKIDMSGV